MRSARLAAACAVVFGFAGLAACSTTSASDASSANAAPSSALVAPDTDGDYTDAQLQTFIDARREIDPINRGFAELSPEQRTQASTQIGEIMRRHEINPATYNAIQQQLGTDQALAERITNMQVATVTDQKLAAFVAASREIQPITATLANASDAERQQAATQIGAILDRHNIDSNLYNALALEAQTNQELAARIAAVGQANTAPEGE